MIWKGRKVKFTFQDVFFRPSAVFFLLGGGFFASSFKAPCWKSTHLKSEKVPKIFCFRGRYFCKIRKHTEGVVMHQHASSNGRRAKKPGPRTTLGRKALGGDY